MLNTMWTLIQTCTLIPTPFTRTCASRMAGTPLTLDKISCFSAQKPRLAQKQQHKQQQQQQQQQHQWCRFPKWWINQWEHRKTQVNVELIVLMPFNSPKLGRIFDIRNRYDMLYI